MAGKQAQGCRPCGCRGPPDFGRSVNPISTRGTDYAHLITTGTPGFSDLPTALRQAVGARLPDLPQVFLRVTNYKDLGLSSKSQPDYPDEKATSLPIYLELSCQHQ